MGAIEVKNIEGWDYLPVVVYVPEGVEVRYRLWSAGQVAKEMHEG